MVLRITSCPAGRRLSTSSMTMRGRVTANGILAPHPAGKVRKLLLFAAVTAIVPILFVSLFTAALQLVWVLRDQKAAANTDFVGFWAPAKLLVHHRNPYDPVATQALEKSVGYMPQKGVTIRSPPLALPLILPLGVLGIKWAAFIWSVLILASVAATLELLWAMHGRPPNKIYMLGWIFPAVLCCFGAGQISAFVLLGVAGFVYFHRKNSFVAGLCVTACAIKPHLLLPFGAVLLTWTLTQRAWRLFLGASAAVAMSLAISLTFDPGVWSHYFAFLRSGPIGTEFIPVIGSLLRRAINWDQMWIQFLPAAVGVVWAIWYFRRNRENWDWRRHGSLLLLVSLLVAPYAWFFDEIIVLPAILHGMYTSAHRQRAVITFLAISCVALIEMLAGAPLYSREYMWTSTAWLCWYVLETRTDVTIRGSQKADLSATYTAGDQALHIGT
jgi:Glycosyltransferase family 87